MTDMTEHPDFETLSAWHDGEAPEIAAHVAGCDECRATAAAFAASGAAIAGPVPPMHEAAVDSAIGEALRVASQEGRDPMSGVGASAPPAQPKAADISGRDEQSSRRSTAPLPRPGRVTRSQWAVAASIAATIVVLAAIGIGVLSSGSSESSRTSTALRAPAAGTAPSAESDAAGRSSAGAGPAGPATGADLGAIADAGQLARAAGPGAQTAAATFPPTAGATAQDQAAAGVPAPKVVGTMACELEARAAAPGSGDVVYTALATYRGTPATVLGLATPGRPGPITLFLMARDGCALLVRTTVP